ncbi:hypothetical protein AMTR_s00019p00130890 [Amborella trichopoda]|uniref:Uncharacterized protein n=1 Tax=Amborella trichopoda TaxID=13333 RepID=W1PGP2_AMBTC|nr:hypothetical protein AMTR_s00019p00130890 [Amborella trichopoda]
MKFSGNWEQQEIENKWLTIKFIFRDAIVMHPPTSFKKLHLPKTHVDRFDWWKPHLPELLKRQLLLKRQFPWSSMEAAASPFYTILETAGRCRLQNASHYQIQGVLQSQERCSSKVASSCCQTHRLSNRISCIDEYSPHYGNFQSFIWHLY